MGIGLFFIGDVLAQRLERVNLSEDGSQKITTVDKQPWDAGRSWRSCSWRAFVWAPTAHYFWGALETHITPRVAHLGHRGTAIKIAVDFATVSPPLFFSFLAWSKLWETSGDVRVTWAHASTTFPRALLAGYCFWLPLHFATYGLVPLRHRMVWVSMCSVGFGCLMSLVNQAGGRIAQ